MPTDTARPVFLDALVVGAGLNGLSAALLLADAGARVGLVDPATEAQLAHPDYDWRTTAVSQGAMRLLDRVGAWRTEWAEGRITEIRIVDGDSPLILHYDGPALGEGDLGSIVPNVALRQQMFEAAAAAPNISMMLGVKTAEVARRADGVDAVLTDGRQIRARLLAAADGRGSPTRKAAGIVEKRFDYGQTAIVATAAHALPHGGVAHERFLPGGPFAILPLPNASTPDDLAAAPWPHRSSVVWTDDKTMAARMLELDRAAFDNEIGRRFGDQYGAVKAVGPIGSFPLQLTLARRMTATRMALVGDAARAIHPIAGQGFNLGLRDSAELASRVREELALGLDPGAPHVLSAFAAARMTDAASLVAATDGLNRLFSNSVKPLEIARRLGLSVVQATPPLKRHFMRHAMGLAGRASKLAGDSPV